MSLKMRDFSAIDSTAYDLVVIGGGINGAATARDGALRGLKTLLLDKGDFASGTTSWSSRLVHGGLRYLEYFEFNLVRESLAEREILLKSAPHLVHPLQLTIPIYAQGSRSYWEIWAGMILYDMLSFDKSLLNHRMLPKAKLKQLFRGVNPQGIQGAGQYYDAQAEYAERLCLENVLAAQDAGATVLNYVKITALERAQGKGGDRITTLTCKDELSEARFSIDLPPHGVIVNTSGPWVDEVCQQGVTGDQSAPIGKTRKIGGTKGSHIIVDAFPGAPGEAFYVEALTDNRPFFILPFLGQYLIGTTDLRFEGDLDRVKADNDEIDYLLTETNKVFPAAQLTRESVKFTYSGVRPLPYTESKKPGAVSRNHLLYDHSQDGVVNMVSLIGGKLTTHRRVGEEMVDWVYARRRQRGLSEKMPACQTRVMPLPGAILPTDERISQAIAQYSDRASIRLSSDTVDHLFQRYGARAFDLLRLLDDAPDLAEPIVADLPDVKAQIVYAVRSEMACTFGDICRRRTMLSLQANYGMDALEAIAQTLQAHCDWSPDECERAIADYKRLMAENCIPDYDMERILGRQALTAASASAGESARQLAVG